MNVSPSPSWCCKLFSFARFVAYCVEWITWLVCQSPCSLQDLLLHAVRGAADGHLCGLAHLLLLSEATSIGLDSVHSGQSLRPERVLILNGNVCSIIYVAVINRAPSVLQ